MSRSIWATLGIKRTRERSDIRRAYAARLKKVHPEDDPDGFKALRDAYEAALAYADSGFEAKTFHAVFNADDAAGALEDKGPGAEVDPGDPPGPPAGWRLTPEPPAETEIEFAIRTLHELINARAPADEVANAVQAILVTPQIAEVDAHNATELLLADLVAHHAPNADGVLGPAAGFFRWRERGRAYNLDWRIRAALDREHDLRFLAAARQFGGWDRSALRALSKPPGRDLPWRLLFTTVGRDVRKFIELLDSERASLEADVHPDALHWWRQRLTRPLFPGYIWPWAMAMALAGAVVGITASAGSFLVGFGVSASAFLTVFAPALMKAYLIDNPSRMRFGAYGQPWWRLVGWAPSGALLLGVVSVAPVSSLLTIMAPVGGVALLAWAWLAGGIRVRTGMFGGWPALIWHQVGLLAWTSIQYEELGAARFWQLTPLVFILVAVFARGADVLYEVWSEHLAPKAKVASLAATAAFCVIGAALLIMYQGQGLKVSIVVALVAVVSLPSLIGLPYLGPTLRAVRHYALWFGSLALVGTNAVATGPQALWLGGVALLAAVIVPAVIGYWQELEGARRASA